MRYTRQLQFPEFRDSASWSRKLSASPKTPDAVLQLVERFREHREDYRRGQYKEFELRREFVDPL